MGETGGNWPKGWSRLSPEAGSRVPGFGVIYEVEKKPEASRAEMKAAGGRVLPGLHGQQGDSMVEPGMAERQGRHPEAAGSRKERTGGGMGHPFGSRKELRAVVAGMESTEAHRIIIWSQEGNEIGRDGCGEPGWRQEFELHPEQGRESGMTLVMDQEPKPSSGELGPWSRPGRNREARTEPGWRQGRTEAVVGARGPPRETRGCCGSLGLPMWRNGARGLGEPCEGAGSSRKSGPLFGAGIELGPHGALPSPPRFLTQRPPCGAGGCAVIAWSRLEPRLWKVLGPVCLCAAAGKERERRWWNLHKPGTFVIRGGTRGRKENP